MLTSFFLSLWLSSKLFSPNRFFGSLALETSENKADGFVSFDTEKQKLLVGKMGVAHTILRPSGKVIIEAKSTWLLPRPDSSLKGQPCESPPRRTGTALRCGR